MNTVGSDKDQQDLDNRAPSIPGLKVVSAKVFETAATARPATVLSPLGRGDLINRGGATLPSINLYAIFWGNTPAIDLTYQNNVINFLTGLNCSGVTCAGLTSTIKQYVGSTALSISFKKQYLDTTSNPPTAAPSSASIANEVVKAVNTVAKDPLDPKGLYLVFTNNYPSSVNYCAWHSAATAKLNGINYPFTLGYMPNVSGVSGCSASILPNFKQSGLGLGFDSLFNVTTHELYETMSDPMTSGNGWIDSKGYENGDKCSWYWSTPLVQSALTFYVQLEYSNAIHGCAASS